MSLGTVLAAIVGAVPGVLQLIAGGKKVVRALKNSVRPPPIKVRRANFDRLEGRADVKDEQEQREIMRRMAHGLERRIAAEAARLDPKGMLASGTTIHCPVCGKGIVVTASPADLQVHEHYFVCLRDETGAGCGNVWRMGSSEPKGTA